MGLLNDTLNGIIRKDEKNYGSSQVAPMMRTGFKVFDYLNGSMALDSSGARKYNIGIDSGKSIMLIGKPGSGKSTLAIQLAYDVSKNFDDSHIYIFDFEAANKTERFKAVTGASDEWLDTHLDIFNENIYTESVLRLAKTICNFKVDNREKIQVKNPLYTKTNDEVEYMLPPTFIIIDSLAMMRAEADLSDDADSAALSANTAGARNAKNNKDLLVQLVQPCLSANVNIIMVNHINAKPSMNSMPAVADTRFMKNDETVSGGRAVQYAANLWVDVEAGKKLDITDPYGIKGFLSTLKIVKSRNAEGGAEATAVFSQAYGFDEDLSAFETLKATDAVKGGGRGMFLDGLEDIKFTAGDFKEKLATIPALRKRFDELTDETLIKNIIPSAKLLKDEAPKTVDVKPVEKEELEGADALADMVASMKSSKK
jgi:RecA/RadA recombinase